MAKPKVTRKKAGSSASKTLKESSTGKGSRSKGTGARASKTKK